MNAIEIRRVLVIGSGAREHALARALTRGSPEREVVVAPGNGGIAGERLSRVEVDPRVIADVVALAGRERPQLIVIGPEAPLCAGLVDALQDAGFVTFGPSQAAARLEGSKAFIKEFATRHAIPTASYRVVRSYEEAEAVIAERGAPLVVKASGLCAGKGVVVADTVEEARAAARAMLVDRVFGDAGSVVVLEDRLVGREVSVHAICDGERFALLPPARDHKRIFDGDRGPNTGGMGVICPLADVGPELYARIGAEIIEPTLSGMKAEGAPFRGVLFAGLMITEDGTPMLLEHNVRFGDPECEALMALVEGDIGPVLHAAASGRLDPSALRVATDRHAVVVVLAAAGYPDAPTSGDPIAGIEQAETVPGVQVHHAGTRQEGGGWVTSGGRVLAVTAAAASPEQARQNAYRACERIEFAGMQYRRDIGASSLSSPAR